MVPQPSPSSGAGNVTARTVEYNVAGSKIKIHKQPREDDNECEYYSKTYNTWMRAAIQERIRDSSHKVIAYTLDVKPKAKPENVRRFEEEPGDDLEPSSPLLFTLVSFGYHHRPN
ncbi:unnamed protein product, partial [Amoebophrya sp. A25]|eukprot:GSA25T00005577001.1